MTESAYRFDDACAYDKFMGPWTRAAGTRFLSWLGALPGMRWLDVGCGSGRFTTLILEHYAPAAVVGIDPARAQIESARRRVLGGIAEFELGDAEALPYISASFDVVVSALALNFIGDRPRALAEMRRVAKQGATAAAYVWDFAAEQSPSWPLRRALRLLGIHVPEVPGTSCSTDAALRSLFAEAGFEQIATTSFAVARSFPNFTTFWEAQTPNYSPLSKEIVDLGAHERARLMDVVRDELTSAQDGPVRYAANANAIKARVP
jgi:ubiquinone/menaquinone biosynthesis C-methylase UbiE